MFSWFLSVPFCPLILRRNPKSIGQGIGLVWRCFFPMLKRWIMRYAHQRFDTGRSFDVFFFEETLSRVPYNAMYVRRPNEDEPQSLLYRSHAVQVVRTRNRCKRNVFLLLGLYVTGLHIVLGMNSNKGAPRSYVSSWSNTRSRTVFCRVRVSNYLFDVRD